MKPYAWAEVHGCAGTTVPWPIASVVVLNVTTVLLTIAYVVLRHAASPVVIHAASAALRSFRDSGDKSQGSDPDKQSSDSAHTRLLAGSPELVPIVCSSGECVTSFTCLPSLRAITPSRLISCSHSSPEGACGEARRDKARRQGTRTRKHGEGDRGRRGQSCKAPRPLSRRSDQHSLLLSNGNKD
jgi:hypothetical protein